ncbi:hypothetical protein [Mycobacterium sp. KBS0706]|uniref:hypothetical protein n=1 Tax=Mycobacterium sp. KBS0706 TaxID=2578109 RepID=UPI00163DD7D7|nr:hypothetical protein [Mycobacterium sp. KBS0706]
MTTAADREPTADGQAGMAWLKALNAARRRYWMQRAGNTGCAADTWATYKHAAAATPDDGA